MPGEGLGDLTTVNLVMDGLRHYDWEVSRITFNFWYRLCETLQQNESTVDRFGYLFESLLKALARLCQVLTGVTYFHPILGDLLGKN